MCWGAPGLQRSDIRGPFGANLEPLGDRLVDLWASTAASAAKSNDVTGWASGSNTNFGRQSSPVPTKTRTQHSIPTNKLAAMSHEAHIIMWLIQEVARGSANTVGRCATQEGQRKRNHAFGLQEAYAAGARPDESSNLREQKKVRLESGCRLHPTRRYQTLSAAFVWSGVGRSGPRHVCIPALDLRVG